MIDLIAALTSDTSSHLCASTQGWDQPLDVTGRLIADVFDRIGAIHTPKGRKLEPHPIRPWAGKPRRQKVAGHKYDKHRAANILAAMAQGCA